MRARNRDQFLVMQYLGDGIAVGLGLLLAYWLRFLSGVDPSATASANYVAQFWTALGLWMVSLGVCGAFVLHPRVISFNRARKILRACGLAILLVAVMNYFTRAVDVARLLYPIAFVTVSIALLVERVLLQELISRFLLGLGGRTRILIVGLGPTAFRLAARCRQHPELAYELVGFVTLSERQVGSRIGGAPVLGTPDDIRRLIRDNGVEEVFVTETNMPHDIFFQLFLDSERETARVNFVPSLVEMLRSSIHYDEVAEIPVYSMRETPLQGHNAAIKRAFDLVLALGGMVALLPAMIPLALLVRLSSPGPVLYRQTRLGFDGREFKIYKFRTMREDAEKHGPGWGNQDDPRATPIGKWMRRWNLDELPQLWNVVRGDMSLVGPRPERPIYVDRFREIFPRYMSRHMVRTGLTGWAQVHGLRGDTSIQQRLRYDLYYIENWSLWLDIKILIMTLWPGKRPRGWARAGVSQAITQAAVQALMEGEQSWQDTERKDRSTAATLGLAAPVVGSGGPSRSASHAPER